MLGASVRLVNSEKCETGCKKQCMANTSDITMALLYISYQNSNVKIELQQSISEHIVFYKFCFMPTGNYQSAFCTKETLKVSLKTL